MRNVVSSVTDQLVTVQSGQRLWWHSGHKRSSDPAPGSPDAYRCTRCRRQVGNRTGSWSAGAADCRRSKQTQLHSSSSLAGLGGVRSPSSSGCSRDKAEPTESGDYRRLASHGGQGCHLLLSLPPARRALLRSRSGPHAGASLSAIPMTTLPPQTMQVALRRRLRLPLQLAAGPVPCWDVGAHGRAWRPRAGMPALRVAGSPGQGGRKDLGPGRPGSSRTRRTSGAPTMVETHLGSTGGWTCWFTGRHARASRCAAMLPSCHP